MPIELWGPWRLDEEVLQGGLADIQTSVTSLLQPTLLLDMLAHYTLFATDSRNRRIKIVVRYQEVDAANKIVERVLAGRPRKGLIWHFQGGAQVAAHGLCRAETARLQPGLQNPTVLIVVDRIDLDAQISATFHAGDIPNLVQAESRTELAQLLRQDTRKIIITTIYKFAEANGNLRARRRTACSTTVRISSSWWTRPTAFRRATWGFRCARRCPTLSFSVSPVHPSTAATAIPSMPLARRKTAGAT